MKSTINKIISFCFELRNKRTFMSFYFFLTTMLGPLLIITYATDEFAFNAILENQPLAITLMLVYLAGFCKAVSDVLQFYFERSIFHGKKFQDWLNPVLSWDNKYFKNKIITFLFKNILVFATDCWHLVQKFAIEFIILAIVFHTPSNTKFLDYLCLRIMFAIGFQGWFKWYLIKDEFKGLM